MPNSLPAESVRPGAPRLQVYNEGLVAFLYDPAHEAEIVQALAAAQAELWDDEAGPKDKTLKALAEKKLIVAWELRQDDALDVELAVGEPPTSTEKRAVPMLKPQPSVLRVVSGRVALHSPNTAPFTDPTDDSPAFADVPSGEYVVHVAHIDEDELARRLGEDAEWNGPVQFVTLTPIEGAKPPKKVWPYLPYPDAGFRALRRWKLENDVFRGEIYRQSILGNSPSVTNMTEEVGRQMGLQFGQIRELKVGKADHHLLIVNVEVLDQARGVFGPATLDRLRSRYPSLYGGCYRGFADRPGRFFAILRLFADQSADVGHEGDKITVGSPVEGVDLDLQPDAWDRLKREEDAIEPVVLGVGTHCVFVACAAADLPGAPGADVDLLVGNGRRRGRVTTSDKALDEVFAFGRSPKLRTKAERDALEAERRRLITASFDAKDPAEGDRLFQASQDLVDEIKRISIPDEVLESGMPFCLFESPHWVFDRPVVQIRALQMGAEVDLPVQVGQSIRFEARKS